MQGFRWLLFSRQGVALRIGVGVCVFVALAVIDLRRNGRAATRWREYTFLLVTVGVALIYGAVNDQITSRISWEYFYYFKGVSNVMGGQLPPDALKLSWAAAKIGMQATWAAGLLVGVACLIANNPRMGRRRLSYRQLLRRTGWVVVTAAGFGVVFGILGYAGFFARFSADFSEMLRRNEFRPRWLMAVYGVHLGGYVGGTVGTALAIASILRARPRVTSP